MVVVGNVTNAIMEAHVIIGTEDQYNPPLHRAHATIRIRMVTGPGLFRMDSQKAVM